MKTLRLDTAQRQDLQRRCKETLDKRIYQRLTAVLLIDTGKTRYEITDMHQFDLFPQTYHIETLVRLRRAP